MYTSHQKGGIINQLNLDINKITKPGYPLPFLISLEAFKAVRVRRSSWIDVGTLLVAV